MIKILIHKVIYSDHCDICKRGLNLFTGSVTTRKGGFVIYKECPECCAERLGITPRKPKR